MRKIRRSAFVAILGLAISGLSLLATGRAAHAEGDLGTLQLGVGEWEASRSGSRNTEVEAVYQTAFSVWLLHPELGVIAAGDGDFYGYGGVVADFAAGPHVVVAPSIAAGAWSGGGIDLGSRLEYRAGMNVSWRYQNDNRLGLDFAHIGNGGASHRNPGSNNITLTFALPIGGPF